ncbi:hypothetical protein DNTS_014113 [Danionella cerebrum]|uniref:CASAMP N-terminal domain-containing protein n=1 Tax=Danionella cerebrum TaxID=2873325 RepID=A0A553NKS1_9TELE|nr:hypothetical protein DNTS_014113 [Danionella translucida]
MIDRSMEYLEMSGSRSVSARAMWTLKRGRKQKTFVVPDIKPLEQYDSSRARICASVGWLLAKSYGNAARFASFLEVPVPHLAV